MYGAGLLSSGGEIEHCLTSEKPLRIPFNLARVMRTSYKIDSYQETYFLIRDFQQLFEDTVPDFTSLYQKLTSLKPLAGNELQVDEINLSHLSDN